MKKVQIISICVLLVSLLILQVNFFITPLPEWIVRADGVILLVALFTVVYSTVKRMKKNP